MRTLIGCLGLVALSGCSIEKRITIGRAAEVPAEVRESAMALQVALVAGKLKAYPVPGSSTAEVMAIGLEPLDDSEPWIRLDAGLKAQPQVEGESVYVTYQTYYVRLHRSKPRVVSIPHLQLNYTKTRSVPKKSELRPMGDPFLRKYFTAMDAMDPQPSWEVLQLATFVLNDDVGRRAISIRGIDGSDGNRGRLMVGPAQIREALDLVEAQGRNREELAMWNDVQDEMDRIVEAYETKVTKGGAQASEAFRQVAVFYPDTAVRSVVVEAFDRHPEDGVDTAIRKIAFETIRRGGQDGAREVLARAAELEEDNELRAMMEQSLANAAPGR